MDSKHSHLALLALVLLSIGAGSAVGQMVPISSGQTAAVAEATVPSCRASITTGSDPASAVVSWVSDGAVSAVFNGQQVPTRGQAEVWPQNSTLYTVVVFDQQGRSASCAAQVVVE